MNYKLLLLFVISLFLFTFCARAPESNENQLSTQSVAADSSKVNAIIPKDVNLNTKAPNDRKFIKTAELKFKVKNVQKATEIIEDLAVKYGGYLTFSNLQNNDENYRSSAIIRDSLLITKQITVVNNIQLRIPNENLDSFIREMNPLILYLDQRIIKLTDITLQFVANQKKTERIENFEKRQKQHIENKSSKLNEATSAENVLLTQQNKADELNLKSLELEDQLKFCELSLNIYQKPLIVKELIANFDYISNEKPKFFVRVWDSITIGWQIFEDAIVYIIKVWGIILITLATFFAIKFIIKLYKKI